MEKSEIIALIEALCERPLEGGQAGTPAELHAFCREAATALLQVGDPPTRPDLDTIADADRLTAALAALLSGSDAEALRRTVEEAMLRSAAARLDAEAAFAFVDAIENSQQTAPAHLVEEMLAAHRAAGTGSAPPRQAAAMSTVWSLIAGGSWSARRWRMAAACAVLLVAGVASWSAYWLQTNPTAGGSSVPMAKTTSEQRSVADAPAAPRPALATAQPCEPRSQAVETASADRAPAAASKADSSAVVDCSPTPGHQFADRPADQNEAIAARQQAEAARQAVSTRAATDAASKVGAAQAGREPGQGPVHADRSGPMFGSRPAATLSAPAAAPAVRSAAPAGIK